MCEIQEVTQEPSESFKRKAIATALAFEDWSELNGEGLTFSTFVNAFGYQGPDVNKMFDTVSRINKALIVDL